ncbi:MAG: hypothetical protein AMXMBFR67_35800 [Nitrospira sp.]
MPVGQLMSGCARKSANHIWTWFVCDMHVETDITRKRFLPEEILSEMLLIWSSQHDWKDW